MPPLTISAERRKYSAPHESFVESAGHGLRHDLAQAIDSLPPLYREALLIRAACTARAAWCANTCSLPAPSRKIKNDSFQRLL